jgi:hypothetical protein
VGSFVLIILLISAVFMVYTWLYIFSDIYLLSCRSYGELIYYKGDDDSDDSDDTKLALFSRFYKRRLLFVN